MAIDTGLEQMDLLDIGGGFSLVNEKLENNFITAGSIISECIDDIFPEEQNLRIIAEPGTFIAESAFYCIS